MEVERGRRVCSTWNFDFTGDPGGPWNYRGSFFAVFGCPRSQIALLPKTAQTTEGCVSGSGVKPIKLQHLLRISIKLYADV